MAHRQLVMDTFDKILFLESREGDNAVSYIEDLERGITYVQVNDEECQADPLESRFVKYRHSQSFAKGLKDILNLDGSDFYFLGKVGLLPASQCTLSMTGFRRQMCAALAPRFGSAFSLTTSSPRSTRLQKACIH